MNTEMYMLTETSEFMMSFVIVTKKNNVIIVDGGRREDMPLLKKYVAGRHVSAWFLTHAHSDHIDGFVHEMAKNGGADFDIEAVYYNFPDYDELIGVTAVPDLECFREELNEMIPAFNAVENKFAGKARVVKKGDTIIVDEVTIDILYSYTGGLYANLMNDSSLVFKLSGEKKSVMFLGDLGPDGGDRLFRESKNDLKADYCQMAHHGHMNVSMEVYAEIMPEACFWCAPKWLYEEAEIPDYLSDGEALKKAGRIRMYGTALTRKWMELLGVKKHYVSGFGTCKVII